MNGPNQLMSLQQFVYDVQDQLNPLASEEDLRHIAQQLHSIGEVSVFIRTAFLFVMTYLQFLEILHDIQLSFAHLEEEHRLCIFYSV